MKNFNHLRICIIILFTAIQFTEAWGCTEPNTAGTIKGKNTVCHGEKVTYSIDTIGLATSYKWTFPDSTQIISGANTNNITVVFYKSGGTIRVQGVNSCDTGVSSSFSVKVDGLPKITISSPLKYCCDYGNIALGSSKFASPAGGDWSCRQKPNLIVSNVFNTSMACDPKKSGIYTLIYTYKNSATTCISTDSTRFTINPLPALSIKNGSFCQDKMDVSLKSLIAAPINLNVMTAIQWRLLKSLPKKGGGQISINDIVYDADPSLNYDFRLKVDTGTIDLGPKNIDSLYLEITIQDGEGCYNKDTARISIIRTPVIKFNAFPEFCINAGIIDLTKTTNATPTKGCWNVINQTGYSIPTNLTPGIVGCDTLNTHLLNLQNGPGLYLMRYSKNEGGCIGFIETPLRLYPLPKVQISATPNQNIGKYCQIDDDVTLNGSPTGGTWSSSVAGAISGNVFKPKNVGASDRDQWISLTYTYTNATTKCDTAKSLRVFVQSLPQLTILTPDIDTCRKDTMNIQLNAYFAFTSKISWFHSFDPLLASFESKQQMSHKNPSIFTIYPPKGKINQIQITAITEAEGVCPFVEDFITIQIDTVPCVTPSLNLPNNLSLHAPELLLFPNPNRGQFSLEIKQAGNYIYSLYSITGVLLQEKRVTGFTPEPIDQNLSPGTYILRVEDSNGYSFRRKLMVE